MNKTPEYIEANWRAGAACSDPFGVDPEVFFMGPPEEARKICGSCAVQSFCLEYALENGEEYGIWGGMTRAQRTQLKRREPGRGVRRESE